MSAEEPLIADLFEVDKRLSLKPVMDFNSYLRNAFGEGPCRCHRCTEGGDQGTYSHAHTFTFDGRQWHRRFASTSGSDVAQALKKAWLSYTKADLNLVGALDLATLKTFTEAALHTRLLALLPASGLAREVDGQWLLQALAD
ncbi:MULTISPECIES: hypothetical protein [Pseudomonas]|uniref:Uncharacterized protein n=1 Tax=Pseudomonas monteilii SB3101 TaxID=1435058 RepID=V9V4W4_9PSED|nr:MULTISPECIES: hypothetical protein [Pseudomonas]AEJ14054.1 conserved hypothetical protein [Pseudomonas putida S16]AHC83524.1 hypothetical protein X969_16770 [Pseudomonas monteilii SB3078]AHC88900.1 hypothetical protein X970_16420 [Pseudomonas monteilii SB3101]KGK26531.1 hypothetical protein GT93_17440 [Pseudomonas plecoglossicida]WOB57198.1 hypothetical protein NY023_18445 [Pseudomonas sp. NBB]